AIHKDGDGFRVPVAFDRVDEIVKEIRYDRVILATGFRFDASVFAESIRPRLVHDDRFPELTPMYESTSVPGMYFAGTLSQSRDFKTSTNGFIHGFRYGVRALHRYLNQRYHDTPWPTTDLGTDTERAVEAVITRVNRSSALWQQFGVLG